MEQGRSVPNASDDDCPMTASIPVSSAATRSAVHGPVAAAQDHRIALYDTYPARRRLGASGWISRQWTSRSADRRPRMEGGVITFGPQKNTNSLKKCFLLWPAKCFESDNWNTLKIGDSLRLARRSFCVGRSHQIVRTRTSVSEPKCHKAVRLRSAVIHF